MSHFQPLYPGVVIDRAYAEYTTNADLTTVIPDDDTIPQSKLDAALAALRALPIEDQQRWTNKTAVYADDARARGLLERIGLDPDVILAP